MSNIFLIGCIKSGVQYGTITTWTANAIGVQEYTNDETLNVYPTCFSASLNITSSLKGKYDLAIMSTNQGIMSHRKAHKLGIGGEVLARVSS